MESDKVGPSTEIRTFADKNFFNEFETIYYDTFGISKFYAVNISIDFTQIGECLEGRFGSP